MSDRGFSRNEKKNDLKLTVVDPGHGGPELLLLELGYRVDRLLPGVRLVPPVLGQDGDWVRSVLQQVVVLGLLALDDVFGFTTDADHGVAEPVDLFLALALGRLDEHTRGDGPRDGRS